MPSFKELTGRSNNFSNDINLEKETYKSFLKLKKTLSFKNIHLDIISSYRSFDRQLIIWNEKALGKRKLYDQNGSLLDYSTLTETQILNSILCWSAIPGASRHHWGTDIDIFDANIKQKKQIALTNEEYENEFKNLSDQLTKLISINKSEGFYRPYNEYKGGISKELWHLSHLPTSHFFEKEYTFTVFKKNIEESKLLLKDLLIKNLEFIFKKYVINTSLPQWPIANPLEA
ncbi:MAG: M15 family metallopeptidase [Bacteriovoracaceae bacterium]|jgi:LAS superfamily LD-carboxypeptidase LdcB|nr:M15 family metallopeptidase [Bacteriovoracaceae bacterium]